ncbi:GCS1 [Scenedesmus sp. PABB004]|nr:GCS1 [Scenedesmus sp. PABB004]
MAKPGRQHAGGRRQAAGRSGGRGLSTLALIALANVAGLAGFLAWRALAPRAPPELTPLRAPLLKALPEFDATYQSNLLWGSYRSGHYFGMRTRTEQPLVMGLMWFDPADPATVQSAAIRHEAQQGDGLASFGWVRHDGRSYGRQELVDGDFRLTVTMVKSTTPGAGGPGGDWAVRVRAALSEAGEAKAAAARAAAEAAGGKPPPRRKLAVVVYMADARWQAGQLELWPDGQPEGGKLGEGVQLLAGDHPAVGPWALHLRPGSGGGAKAAARAKLTHLGARLQDGHQLVGLKQLMVQALAENARRLGFDRGLKLWLPSVSEPRPNLGAFQVTATLPAEFDAVFVSHPDAGGDARLVALSGGALAALAAEREALFDSRFELTFAPAPAPGLDGAALAETAKAALSNLLGGMGYFVGASRVKLPPGAAPPPAARPGADPTVAEYWRAPLFTAVPSRSFFPRGFLWDEGFHQLLVARWDPQLSRDALAHWLDLMSAAGWIPREQILGAEARARVPPEFVTQHPSHANPPSLFLPLLTHARAAAGGGGGEEAARTRAFLGAAWPRLEVWYRWFNTTQAGTRPGSYTWKGRDASTRSELNPKTLMSGLDDYPRASHPTPDERHVDLLAWMALASRAMAEIGAVAGAPAKAVARYASAAAALGSPARLRELHWDEASGAFADYGLHTEDVSMQWTETPGEPGQPPKRELVRVVGAAPRLQLVPSVGYVSIFPLLMQLLPPDAPELGRQLELLSREDLLWTPHGLRSLATTSSIYNKHNTEHDAPYWRGPIWVNVNYLALSALHHYGATPGPHRAAAAAAYAALRGGLLANLVGQYGATGYLWEQYGDADGAPKGCRPFTGWTALVALIAAEAY